jgi:acyl-CoA thioesterase
VKRQVDDLAGDEVARRRTPVWLASAVGQARLLRIGRGVDAGRPGASLRSDPGADVDDELEHNRAAMHTVFADDGYAGAIGARLIDWGGGWSQVELTVADDHANFAGLLHGGVTFGLGDAAFAVASNSWGRLSVALSVDVHFLGTVPPGTALVAMARERHRTKRTGAYLIEVRSRPNGPQATDAKQADAEAPAADGGTAEAEGGTAEAEGPLIGSLHALVHRTDRWLLGEDAWSADWRTAH